MGNQIIYLLIIAIGMQVFSHGIRLIIENREKEFLKIERQFLLTPSIFDASIFSILSVLIGDIWAHIFHIEAAQNQILFIIILAFVLTMFYAIKNFSWIHFLEDKIVIHYPITKSITEIDNWKIRRSGYRPAYRKTLYFIEYYEKGEIPKIEFIGMSVKREELRKYFSLRDIDFQG